MAKSDGLDCAAYRDHLRPHTAEERARLEASLLAEGCRDPLAVAALDGRRYLIDGFHRKDVCDARGIPYETREVAFETGEQVLRWIEANGRARRNQTRTERLYYVGRRYNREKGRHGTNQHTRKDQLDPSCDRIAAEEHVGPATVKRAGKFAALLDEACAFGLGFLKWPVLAERLRVTPKLLARLIELGAGGCRDQVEGLLAAAGADGFVTAAAVKKAIGDAADQGQEGEAKDVVAYGETALNRIVGDAMTATPGQVARLIEMVETARSELRAVLKSRGVA